MATVEYPTKNMETFLYDCWHSSYIFQNMTGLLMTYLSLDTYLDPVNLTVCDTDRNENGSYDELLFQ